MRRKITILFAALLLSCGLTWAQQISWTAAEQGYENAEVIENITFDSHVSADFEAGTNSNAPKYYSTGSAIRCYGGNYFTVTSDYLLTEIILGFGSGDGTNAISTDCGTYADGTWTGSANSVTFSIGGTSGHRKIATFTITYTESGTPAPTITIENNNEIAYNATNGSFNFTVNNPVNNGNMTVATEEEWISNPSIVGSAVNFNTTVNQAGTPREGVITLIYTYDDQSINKPVTVTQAGNPDATMTIAEVRAQGTGDVATLGTVTSITGTSNKTAYIQDATAAIVVYGNFTAAVGDEIRVFGTLSDFNGLLEIANPVVTVVSSGNTINPELMTVAEAVASTNQGWYIRIEEATVSNISGSGNSQNTTISQGENTIVVRGNLGITAAVNDIISLNGNIGYYNGNQIANPQNVEVQQNTEPTITITDATVNVQADASQGTIEVTYQNITEIVANVYFCDADGAAATYDWIYAEIDDDNNIYYNVNANDGAARTAYLKVNNGDVYSNLVTINQAQYVADFAILPFEFDGGREDVANTNGLTQYGLGSDYASSPKLKFDSADDWMILHFNEDPGMLLFDIRGTGNPFQGTFTLETSADGINYETLDSYDELGDAETKTYSDLDTDVRYIRWYFTEKVSGCNVGIGNIHLYEFGGGPVAETYDLTIEPFENLEIFTFVDDELTEPMEGPGTIQVTEGVNVMLSVSANEGYVLESLMVDGVEHVNDIAEDLTYTFVMPNHNVTVSATAVEDIPFEPATYTLATSIESGKTYIIVGFHEGEAFAMGEQRSNNRKGVSISVDGNTATVETAEVHEFVITALEEDGFYSIFDEGYLYAASSTGNQLKTKAELDVHGQWEISVDTTAHIVASNSSNHNVMQFNYNNNNPALFSCYSEASQSPVYLYVKEEATTTVTQTIALAAGASWVSFNVETTLNDLKAALLEATEGVQAITIQEQLTNIRYNPNNHRWTGQLTALDMAKMYKISVEAACEITLEGMPVDPTALLISIASGSNWIAYPLRESMSVANAFAGFAVNGDKVQEQNSNANYSNGRWSGQLRNLVPGAGYIYQSGVSESRTLVFPSVSGNKK